MQYFLFIVTKYRFTHNFTQIIIFNLGRIVYDGMDRIVYVKGAESSYGRIVYTYRFKTKHDRVESSCFSTNDYDSVYDSISTELMSSSVPLILHSRITTEKTATKDATAVTTTATATTITS